MPLSKDDEERLAEAFGVPSYGEALAGALARGNRGGIGRYEWMELGEIEPFEPLMRRQGVSEVARSKRGFLTAYKRSGGTPERLGRDPKFGQDWVQRRNSFVARHMGQITKRGEPLWEGKNPTRRHLALIAWAYTPDPDRVSEWLGARQNPPPSGFVSKAEALRVLPNPEGYPDDAEIFTDGMGFTCSEAKWALAKGIRNVPPDLGVRRLACVGVWSNEGGGLFWEVRGRGFGRHLVWKEGGKVHTMPFLGSTRGRFRISEVPAIKVLAMLGKPNPRTALKWTYDPSKVQWSTQHGGFRWFLERRDGGDPRYPREYLYKTTGRGLDRVAKRDIKPLSTPSGRKRRNVQAKEWAESFILSDLEQLSRALKNPKRKPRKIGEWRRVSADQWQDVVAEYAWRLVYGGKRYILTVDQPVRTVGVAHYRSKPQSHARLWEQKIGAPAPRRASRRTGVPVLNTVPGALIAERAVTAKNIVTLKRQVFPWAEQQFMNPLHLLAAEGRENPRARKNGRMYKSTRKSWWEKVPEYQAELAELEARGEMLNFREERRIEVLKKNIQMAFQKVADFEQEKLDRLCAQMVKVIECPKCGAGQKKICRRPGGQPAGYSKATKSRFHKARWDQATEMMKHPIAVLGLLGGEDAMLLNNPRTSWARAGKKQRSTRRRRDGRRDIAERLPVTAKFEFVGSRGVTPEEREEWLADEREKTEKLANRYVKWATVHPKISEGEWEVAFGEGHPDYSRTRRGEFLRQSVLSVFRAAVEHGDYAETQIWAIVRLAGGEWGYLEAGCDTTGWDCQSYNAFAVADKLSELIPKLSDRGRHKLGLESDLQLLPLLARENRRR